jgi:MFS family permease
VTTLKVDRVHDSRLAYATIIGGLYLLSVATNLPTALYQLYAEHFQLSPFQVSVVYAVYGVSVIPLLLIFGWLSDRIGRRPVLVVAAVASAASMVTLAVATDLAILLVGRVLQAVAVGAFSGTGAAALVELNPSGSRQAAGLAVAISQVLGGATGPLLGGIFAQSLPDPLIAPFACEALISLGVAVVFVKLPESRPVISSSLNRRLRVSLDRRDTIAFISASAAGALAWMLGGLFVALMPGYVSETLGRREALAGGALVCLMLVIAAAAQLLLRTLAPVKLQAAGLATLIVGLAAVAVAEWNRSFPMLVVAAIICGVSFGCGYLGGVVKINELAPPDKRGSVTSIYFCISYVGGSLPIVALGILATAVGSTGGVIWFAAVSATAAGALLAWIIADAASSSTRAAGI